MRSILLATLLLGACAEEDLRVCTDIGCADGIDIAFERAAFEPGVYTVQLDLHGDIVLCQATIPLDSEPSDGCDDARVFLYLSGSALGVDEQRIEGVFVDSTEISALAVTVWFEEEEIGYAAFEPDYQVQQPNGPDCDPTCHFASHELALD